VRTTLDIADDVLQAAKERAKRERKTNPKDWLAITALKRLDCSELPVQALIPSLQNC
jgi:hypothetical protein